MPFESMLMNDKVIFGILIAVIVLSVIGLIIFGIILAKIRANRFIKSCKTISDFANESGVINDNNLEQFEATCIDEKTNSSLLEGWEAFKASRFGYPSEYMDKNSILSAYDAKKFKISVFTYFLVIFAISVLTSIYALFTTKNTEISILISAIVCMLAPIILLLSYIFVNPRKKTEIALSQMLDDLDTAVQLQNYVERKIDNNRLEEIQNKIRDVILSEQSKPIPSKVEQLKKEKAKSDKQKEDEIRAEIFGDDDFTEPIEYSASDIDSENISEKESAQSDSTENSAIEEQAETEISEEIPDEIPQEENGNDLQEDVNPPKKQIKFEPFVNLLDQAIGSGLNKATLRRLADVIVLAFTKFSEPSQREALKNSIRKFIVAYKAAVAAEKEEEESAESNENYDNNSIDNDVELEYFADEDE